MRRFRDLMTLIFITSMQSRKRRRRRARHERDLIYVQLRDDQVQL